MTEHDFSFRRLGDEPAHPVGSGDMRDPIGLTKREAFAMAAMTGICANAQFLAHMAPKITGIETEKAVAIACREMADALLAELAKVTP